ncbi:cobyrinate a,c-diamide synthase [uncultured Megasphaera sp.]|uniref:cobyrinate a,c-diamide synthase n=1 Tax=uncultured Megasphaera sp. TaxID=165188 RepID=UPI00259B2A07|nr:cobyrinate a,c-diamide synthase [uncultured Megasphaera sp.]
MVTCNVPRLMVTGTHSGCGKTTVMCALLAALKARGHSIVAYKSGPDYIDPLFHKTVLHVPSYNLDLFLLGRGIIGKQRAMYLFATHAQQADIAICEGAMGFFDGVGTSREASSYEVADTLQLPTILVVDGKHASASLGAVIQGFLQGPNKSHIVGFIVNRCKPMVYMYFKEQWESCTGIRALGYLPDIEECRIESRHLGLVTPHDIFQLQEKIQRLRQQAEQTLALDDVVGLARTARTLRYPSFTYTTSAAVRIGVAQDEAFCFYYADSLALLQQLGATLVPFSPLRDLHLPDCDGIYLGGGYPELYAEQLADNISMKRRIRVALLSGMPCFAECGGFLYLLSTWQSQEKSYAWSGLIKGTGKMKSRLVRFGYQTLHFLKDTALGKKGMCWPAHEFHYSDTTNNGTACLAIKAARSTHWLLGHGTKTLFASYAHLHLWGNPVGAARFIHNCWRYQQGRL